MSEKFRKINAIIDALREAGLADDNTQRIVIDVKAGHLPVAYIQRIIDTRFLDVIPTLQGGIQIKAIVESPDVTK